jgi:hypothetical protein
MDEDGRTEESSRDHDYESTIAKARRYVCILLFAHLALVATQATSIFLCGSE